MRQITPLLIAVCVAAPLRAAPAPLTLGADSPAASPDAAYAVGNGRLGAIASGVFPKCTVTITESSVHSGAPEAKRESVAAALKKIRGLCRAGNYAGADAVMRAEVLSKAPASGDSRRPAGFLEIEHLGAEKPSGVRRELDMGAGVALETEFFETGKNKVKSRVRMETVAAPEPFDVVAVRLSGDKPMTVAFSLARTDSLRTSVSGSELVLSGDAGGRGATLFETRVRILPGKDGKIEGKDGRLVVTGSREIVALVSVTTDFDIANPDTPSPRLRSAANIALLDESARAGWNRLRGETANRFRDAMARCSVDLGDSSPETAKLDTPGRLARLRKGGDDPDLLERMFQFGRYRTVVSTRPGALPVGLYAGDIDDGMSQWASETTGLGEFRKPAVDFVRAARSGGAALAAAVGAEGLCFGGGSDVLHTGFGEAGILNGARLGAHLVERHRFGGDREDLKKSLPYLRESVRFVLAWFEADPKTGEFVSGPGLSPGNLFLDPAPVGKNAGLGVSLGCAFDRTLGRRALLDYIFACEETGARKDELYARAVERLAKTPPPRIAPDGRLQEWSEPFGEADPRHRRVDHLGGLFPGGEFASAPAYVSAVRKSLDALLSAGGGDDGAESAGRIANLYANTGDGDKSLALLRRILAKHTGPNLVTLPESPRNDGNFGFTSAVAECLLQSRHEENGRRVVTLLPALPGDWRTGSAEGLRARGGLVVDLRWTPSGVEAEFVALRDGKFRIRYRKSEKDLDLRTGDRETVKF